MTAPPPHPPIRPRRPPPGLLAICARAARRIRRLVDGDHAGNDGDDDRATGALLTDAARAPLAPAAGLRLVDECAAAGGRRAGAAEH